MKNLLLLFLAFPLIAKASHTRNLYLNENDVGEVCTAIRYSTILEFDSRPLSVVVGDQDAFKVEYIGNSITIKPLLPSSTNMFVMTDYDKFNFKIRTTNADKTDYKVKVKRKPPKELSSENGTRIHFRSIGKSSRFKDIVLELTSIGAPKAKNLYLLTFSLALMRNGPMENFPFKAGNFHLRQDKKEIVIDSLSIDTLELSRDKPVASGTITIRRADLKSNENINLIFSPEKRKELRILVPLTSKEGEANENQKNNRPILFDGKDSIFRQETH